jgi:hypothetical protein
VLIAGRTDSDVDAHHRSTDPEQAEGSLPVWFGTRMLGLRGSFGLVLTTGDVLRITSITALHEAPHGVILLGVLLDHAGVPDGVDQAWQVKHYLGAPVPGDHGDREPRPCRHSR